MIQKERNSSFELLRIISMLLIVMHHYSVHGSFDFMSRISLRLYFIQCLSLGGKPGVNLFVLISGYFLCQSKFKWQRLVKLELEVLFYSAVIGVLFCIFLPEREPIQNLRADFMPLLSERYWFYSTYFVLVLISPFINKMLPNLEKKEFRKLLALLFVLWVVIPFIPKVRALQMSNLGWFVFLYLCAAYIRNYGTDFAREAKTYILAGISCYILMMLFTAGFDLLALTDSSFQPKFACFLSMNNILVLLTSILLLIGFSKWHIGHKKAINTIASATFGIYLIHDNELLRPFLWVDVFRNASYFGSHKLFLHGLAAIAIVFSACALIDILRIALLEKPLFFIAGKIKMSAARKASDKTGLFSNGCSAPPQARAHGNTPE